MYYLGIDTSCYTTSIALIDKEYNLIYDKRIVLNVKKGNRGLRQSEAVFQHQNNLNKLICELFDKINPQNISKIAVSSKPRDKEDSYMPVFTTGINIARIIASSLNIELAETSHQQGHIAAGLWSCKQDTEEKIMVYHVSGGTSELLKVDIQENLKVTAIGGSSDLNAGQFVDRIGVSLGLNFPCGKEMDRLCSNYDTQPIEIPISANKHSISFSGPETFAQRIIAQQSTVDCKFASALSKGVFLSIAKTLEKSIINAIQESNIKDVLMVGGVMSNTVIKYYLLNSKKLITNQIRIYFADTYYSTDNAVGTALIGLKNKNPWRTND